ncbi:hypothetical protein EVAR_74706_1, partial [Eumeta japonica]
MQTGCLTTDRDLIYQKNDAAVRVLSYDVTFHGKQHSHAKLAVLTTDRDLIYQKNDAAVRVPSYDVTISR